MKRGGARPFLQKNHRRTNQAIIVAMLLEEATFECLAAATFGSPREWLAANVEFYDFNADAFFKTCGLDALEDCRCVIPFVGKNAFTDESITTIQFIVPDDTIRGLRCFKCGQTCEYEAGEPLLFVRSGANGYPLALDARGEVVETVFGYQRSDLWGRPNEKAVRPLVICTRSECIETCTEIRACSSARGPNETVIHASSLSVMQALMRRTILKAAVRRYLARRRS